MTKHRKKQNHVHDVCCEVHEDDGIDPREYFGPSSKRKQNRKSLQLCGHIAKLMNAALMEFSSTTLPCLYVVAVLPAPTLSQVEIVVDGSQVPERIPMQDILLELSNATPRLRADLARVLARKYVPEFRFRLAAPHEVPQ